MINILTSMFHKGFTADFSAYLRKAVTSRESFAFVASEFKHAHDITDGYSSSILKLFSDCGIEFESFFVVDSRMGMDEASRAVRTADVVWLAGGDTPTQFGYFREFGLIPDFRDRQGITIGMSAGAINMAETAICSVTCEHSEQLIYPALGLVNISVEPHINVGGITQELLDLSQSQPIYGMSDESVIICEDDKTIYMGEIVFISKGLVTPVTPKELVYRPLEQSQIEALREILDEGSSLPVEAEYECFYTVYMNERLVGLAQIELYKTTSTLIAFVAPRYRRQGIGRDIVRFGEDKIRAFGSKKIDTDYISTDEASRRFAKAHGYHRGFSSALMRHDRGKFSSEALPIRKYTDADYVEAHKLYAEAFHEMRVSVGDFPDSSIEQPGEDNRRAWLARAENSYVFLDGDEIVGYGLIDDDELSLVSIRRDMQGMGIGRNFVKYLCNEVYKRGSSRVELWCVVGNKARQLYDSLGFEECHISEFSIKKL